MAFTDPWLDNGVALGAMSKAELDAGQVAIGPALARNEGLRPGDVLDLATPTGTAHLPVMAVAYNGNFGGRNVQMSYALLEELYGPQAPFNVVVVPEEGVSEAELARRIEAADLDPGLDIRLRQEVIDNNTADIAEQLSTFDAIQRGLLVMSFIAVLSTLLLVGVQRQQGVRDARRRGDDPAGAAPDGAHRGRDRGRAGRRHHGRSLAIVQYWRSTPSPL